LRRRTFAIISLPDAGKTTLTEKLLLFGGVIQLAGEVKARGDGCAPIDGGRARASAVISFEQERLAFNLFDTPVHRDFSPVGFRETPTAC